MKPQPGKVLFRCFFAFAEVGRCESALRLERAIGGRGRGGGGGGDRGVAISQMLNIFAKISQPQQSKKFISGEQLFLNLLIDNLGSKNYKLRFFVQFAKFQRRSM